ncbi:MAG: hypothetical protein KAI83_16575 [Thiomargarita sp.]|nr:hypothetical protein [Thiomargarita sp.]
MPLHQNIFSSFSSFPTGGSSFPTSGWECLLRRSASRILEIKICQNFI